MPPEMATGGSYSYFRNGNIRLYGQKNKFCPLVTSISKAAVGDSRSNKAPCQLLLQLVAHGEILVDAFIAVFGESAAW